MTNKAIQKDLVSHQIHGSGYPYANVSFTCKCFKHGSNPTPLVVTETAYSKGKPTHASIRIRRIWDFVLHLGAGVGGVFLPHLAGPEDDAMTATPRRACKNWF
jgi:hypothetical protein